jgi:glycerol-3-phosphate acyltransferase PlsX
MRIAIDAMGGDFAPGPIVEGALAAARQHGFGLVLAGPRDVLSREIARHAPVDNVELVDAPDVVAMHEAPVQALRQKPGASVRVAIDQVARGRADAVFTAGHTGAAVVAAHGLLGRMPGIDRPALAATLPTVCGAAVLVDAGANVDCRPQHLVQFGLMGRAYAAAALGIEAPRVAVLSIGEEETKGTDLIREAHRLLKACPELDFVGNVEARDLYAGVADVVVCDGFTGNVALKVSEGLVDALETLVREELTRTFSTRFGLLLQRRAFRRVRRRVDYAEYGAAPLLGAGGLCLVGHGRSSVRAVRSGVELAARCVSSGLMASLARAVEPSKRAGLP